jgi:nitrogen PTS system EIIA component
MELGVKDVARLLRVSEKTVYRWIAAGDLPAHRFSNSHRFDRVEILEWATSRGIRVPHEIFSARTESTDSLPALLAALQAGGIHYRVAGSDKDSVLQSVVQLLPLPEQVDRGLLLRALLTRESLGSTGIGDGIAIPHVRNPIVLHIRQPVLTLCFLETSIDFGALDGKPVDTLFVILSNTVRVHLHLLARLSYLLSRTSLREIVARKAESSDIIAAVSAVEQSIGTAEDDRRKAVRDPE